MGASTTASSTSSVASPRIGTLVVLAALTLSIAGCQATAPAVPAPPAAAVAGVTNGKAAPLPRVRTHDAIDATVASLDGVPIRYHVEGSGEPALVFIHGWGCDRSHWAEQVERFGAERQVIALDLAGHGQSGKDRKEWTMASLGDDVRAVVLALDVKRVVLIGHSMGGPVALEAARRMPERVVAVIGVDTFHNVERRVAAVQADALLGLWQNDYAGASHKFVESLVPPDTDPALRQRLETQFASASPDVSLPILRATFAYDLAAGFDRVHAPIRAINTTLATDVEADRRHSADFAVVDLSAQHLGHFPMLTAPALFDQQLADVLNGLGVPTAPVAVPVPPGAAAPAPPPHPAP